MTTPDSPLSSRRTRYPSWLSSIRTVMIVLIILATIFPLGVIFYQSSQRRTQAYTDSRILSEKIADQVVFEQHLLLSSAVQLFSTFSHIPAIRRRDAAAVNALLAELIRENPQITNIVLADEHGSVWASGLPIAAPFTVSDRRYFINAIATGRFSSGEYNMGRILNRPALLFGYPLKDRSGRIDSMAIVSFSLDKYDRLFRSKGLAADVSLSLLDHKGTFLFTRPTSGLIGQQDNEELFRKMTAGPDEGSMEGVERTGVRRVFAYRKLRLPGEPQPYMYVRAGIPVSAILERTRKEFLLGMGTIGLAAALILLAGVLFSKRFVLDKITALKETTERISRGELSARVPEIVSGGDIGDLGEAFDAMIRRLQEAEDERRENEEALRRSGLKLRESEERFRGIFNTAGDGILIARKATRKFVDANAAICGLLGYTREELLGLGVEDIHPASDVPFVIAEYQRHGRDNKQVAEGLPVKRKDGSVFYADVSGNPIEFEGEQYQVGIFRDITARKQAEAERNRLTAAIEQTGETVVITDPGGAIQYVNPAFERTTGYSRQEAIGRNPRILKSGRQDEAFYRGMWRTISEGRTWEGRMVNKRKDGTFYTEDATISPVFDAAGRIVSFVAVKRDITEHLRLAEQFQQSQKMESVGRLAGGVAHDFNNLLTVINGYSELLLQNLGKDSPMHGQVEEIRRAGERAASLTQQLLAFSRKQIIDPKVVHLDHLVGEMQKMLGRLIGEDISMQVTTGKGLGSVKVDPVRFQQILMNLVVNARDAMPDGGKITIETANVDLDEWYCALHPDVAPGRFVMLSVSDTGAGMSDEVKAHIFEPFFTTKERGSGTGLGLAMTYGAVHQAGGSIEVYSERGTGTTFKIYLPRVEEEAGKPADDGMPADLPGGAETVLVVEDEESVRNVCVRILELLGYRVLQASNGADAIVVAHGYGDRIDLLLTDVVMPEMNGSELAAQLVLHRPEMKVLFTSGYTEDAIVRRGVLDDGVSFIGKPYSPGDLARKVREVFGKA